MHRTRRRRTVTLWRKRKLHCRRRKRSEWSRKSSKLDDRDIPKKRRGASERQLTQSQAGVASASTTRTTEGTSTVINGTSEVIDGLMAVTLRLAHNRQGLTVEAEADMVQMKKPEERSQPREREGEATEARDKETHANEATTTEDSNAKRKSPTRTDNDEEASQALHIPERNSGRNARDSWRTDAEQEAAHGMSECKNWPPMHDLSKTVATRIIKIIRWQYGHIGTRVGEARRPGQTTIHAAERETQRCAGSQYETEPATESWDRNTLASSPAATGKDRTDTTRNAIAGRSMKNTTKRQSMQTSRNMSTLSGPNKKQLQYVVWQCLRNAGLP